MRNFISELNGLISGLQGKKMTDIPVEAAATPGNPTPTPLTQVELVEKEIKEYINSKINSVVGSINSGISALGGDSPFYHKSAPRKKTLNEMYIDSEELVDTITIYGDNYKDTAKQSYALDIVVNSELIKFTFAEIPALNVSVYNTSDNAFWTNINPVTEKPIIDGLFVGSETEITTFNNSQTSNSGNIAIIVAENMAYFARMKRFLALDKTAKYITNVDPIGQPLYDSRIATNQAKIDEILANQASMSEKDFVLYMAAEREALKIER